VDSVAHLTINTGTSLGPDPLTTCAAACRPEGGTAVEGLQGDKDEDDEDDEASDWDESDDWSDEEDLAAFELEVASFLAAVKHQSRSHARAVRVSPSPVTASVTLPMPGKDALISAQPSPHTRVPNCNKL
jgi:hypothetical protein